MFQVEPSARNMRYKSWPYYKDWEVIFGKDRAQGDTSQVWQNVVEEEAYVPAPVEVTIRLIKMKLKPLT